MPSQITPLPWHPDIFWHQCGQQLHWHHPYSELCRHSHDGSVDWYVGGQTNAVTNTLVRHAQQFPDRLALIWEAVDGVSSVQYTYAELLAQVEKFSAVLYQMGVRSGDQVVIVLTMMVELPIAMLACARLGACHVVLHARHESDWLAKRITELSAQYIITATQGYYDGQYVGLHERVVTAINHAGAKTCCLVIDRYPLVTDLDPKRDLCYSQAVQTIDSIPAEVTMDANDVLFLVETTGSRHQPRLIAHRMAGYLVYAAMTHAWALTYCPEQIYWCTADLSDLIGHSYALYGPLLNGGMTLLYEGQEGSEYWRVIEKYRVSTLYTTGSLWRYGDDAPLARDLTGIQMIAIMGELLYQPVATWYYHVIGQSHCRLVHTWSQTEAGGIVFASHIDAEHLDLIDSIGMPCPGLVPMLQSSQGVQLSRGCGVLHWQSAWPGQAMMSSGDDCMRRDLQGYYWWQGHQREQGVVGIEQILAAHQWVCEAAVLVLGDGYGCAVTLRSAATVDDGHAAAVLTQWLCVHLPQVLSVTVRVVDRLPKTSSGCIARYRLMPLFQKAA